MTIEQLIAWFKEAEQKQIRQTAGSATYTGGRRSGEQVLYNDPDESSEWVASVGCALDAAFPTGHFLRRQWDETVQWKIRANTGFLTDHDLHSNVRGIVRTALGILTSNRLSTLTDGVRAASVKELLDQAQALAGSGYLVAATVIAGGALEMHLLHYCGRHGLTWKDDGSIAKYDGAVAQARNGGRQGLYVATDSKLIIAWGGMRNDAAHEPAKFSRSRTEVDGMISAITEFVGRSS